MSTQLFIDRVDAGRCLANALRRFGSQRPIVLGLPRGGVPVAREVAHALGGELDVWVVRKLGAPLHEELGMGAVAEGDEVFIDPGIVEAVGATPEQVEQVVARKLDEVRERCARFRSGRVAPRLEGRVVIVVDDGIATGGTARAALRAIRKQRPAKLILAAPVGATRSIASLEAEADEIVCLEPREHFVAVGRWYSDFGEVTDDMVLAILAEERPVRAPVFAERRSVTVDIGDRCLHGDLVLPERPIGLVLFAHGSGSNRASPRNRRVAEQLHHARVGTLLLDLLTDEEAVLPYAARFDIRLLADRLAAATAWVGRHPELRLPIGYYGASTGAAAALVASLERHEIRAIVSRGGRPDLAFDCLPRVTAPTLLIVGGDDTEVLALNRQAFAHMHRAEKRIEVVEGATHLFEEPGTLERAGRLARRWFVDHLTHRKPMRSGWEVEEPIVECMDCGASIDSDLYRAFTVTPEWFLCFDCAVSRGGVYDTDKERWTTAPEVVGEIETPRSKPSARRQSAGM